MARIFKTTYPVGPRGARRRVKSKKWYAGFDLPGGGEGTRAGYTDKDASLALAVRLEQAAARGEEGLVDKYEAHRKRTVTSHIEDLYRALIAKGTTEKQARLVKTRVLAVVEGCGFERLGDITAGKVAAFLADLRGGTADRPGISMRTSNFHLGAVSQFCKWAVRDGRMSENPLTSTTKLKVTDAGKRRALTPAEQSWLLTVTAEAPQRFGMSGAERMAVYATALGSGFRASELGSLTRAAFDLDGKPPTITLAASDEKNRKGAVQPITGALVGVLREHFANKLPAAVAFNMPANYDTADMIRADMADARATWIAKAGPAAERQAREQSGFLLPETDQGTADFHSLRHSYGSNLARAGAAPKVVMDLMRHSDVNLTMRLYSHTLVADRGDALGVLPDPESRPSRINAPASRSVWRRGIWRADHHRAHSRTNIDPITRKGRQ